MENSKLLSILILIIYQFSGDDADALRSCE